MNTSLAKYSTFAAKDARITELEVELSTAAKVVRKCHDERDAAWTKLALGEVRIGELDRKCEDSIRAIVFERTISERAEAELSTAKAEIEKWKCPIGLEASHMLCSAGTCFVCTQSLRNDWDGMQTELAAAKVRIGEEEALTKIVLDSYAAENQQLHDRVERAESELEADRNEDYIAGLMEGYCLGVVEDYERRDEIIESRMRGIKESQSEQGKVLENEVQVLREALEWIRTKAMLAHNVNHIEVYSIHRGIADKARAALAKTLGGTET